MVDEQQLGTEKKKLKSNKKNRKSRKKKKRIKKILFFNNMFISGRASCACAFTMRASMKR
jgi:hypothetical protein